MGEQIMRAADCGFLSKKGIALFGQYKPPGEISRRGGRFIYESRHVTGASEGHWIWMVEFLGSCLCSFLGMDSCRMPFSNLAATSPASTSSPT